MAAQRVACPYRRASCHRYGMPSGKTWSVLWFSSMIRRILLTPPPAAEARDDGEPAAADSADAETDAGAVLVPCPDGVAPVPQPPARQPTSPAPISRASRRARRAARRGWCPPGGRGSGVAGLAGTRAGLRTHPTVVRLTEASGHAAGEIGRASC